MNRDNLRKNGRKLLRPLVSLLAQLRVGPSSVTVFGLLVTACASWLIWGGNYLIGAIVLLVGSILDAVDGELARGAGCVTPVKRSCIRDGPTEILLQLSGDPIELLPRQR